MAYNVSKFPKEEFQSLEHFLHSLQVGHAEDGSLVPVMTGRPAVQRILEDIAAENSDLSSVGVFAAGPQSMVRGVRLCCAKHNDSWKAPFLDFSSHSFDL